MSQRMTSYTRWSFNYPPGTVIPDGFVYGISYALFGIDSLSGYVLASRAPAGAWEPGAYLTREVQIPEETQPWFCSQETRPLLIMTEHGLGLLSKRYLPACGVGLLIHFHVPGKRGAAAVNRGLLQTDWIVSESVRAMGAGRCDAETYQVLTEAAYELPDSRIRLQRRDSQVRFGKSRSRPGQPAAGAPAPDAGDDHAERSRRGLADEPALQRNRTVPVLTGQTSLTGSSGAHTRQSGAGRHPAFGHPRRTAHTFAPCVNDW